MQLDGDLVKLMEGVKKLRIPDNYPVKCTGCDWRGAFSDCPVDPEQDGWEMPVYMISVCPDCGEVICL